MQAKSEWTDTELLAAVESYLRMLNQEAAGVQYSKAAINQELRNGKLQSRSRASIEYRMRNISATLEELCLPRIKGYLPAQNVGAKVKESIRKTLIQLEHINQLDFTPTARAEELEERVSRLRRRTVSGVPKGNRSPKLVETISNTFARDPLVKAFVLNQASGICEGCQEKAPFVSLAGDPYLEVHHVLPLAQGGSDTASNAVALCPNCHRRAHYSNDRKNFISRLYEMNLRLVLEPN